VQHACEARTVDAAAAAGLVAEIVTALDDGQAARATAVAGVKPPQ
jgi:hypothetical protein